MTKDEILRKDLVDLLNQIMIRLQMNDIPLPKRDEEYDVTDHVDGGTGMPIAFQKTWPQTPEYDFSCLRAVVEAALEDFKKHDKYHSDIEKMARAYYSSFCNA